MKKLISIVFLFCVVQSFGQGNWPVTGTKTRFGNGMAYSSKSSAQLAAFNAATDSILWQVNRVTQRPTFQYTAGAGFQDIAFLADVTGASLWKDSTAENLVVLNPALGLGGRGITVRGNSFFFAATGFSPATKFLSLDTDGLLFSRTAAQTRSDIGAAAATDAVLRDSVAGSTHNLVPNANIGLGGSNIMTTGRISTASLTVTGQINTSSLSMGGDLYSKTIVGTNPTSAPGTFHYVAKNGAQTGGSLWGFGSVGTIGVNSGGNFFLNGFNDVGGSFTYMTGNRLTHGVEFPNVSATTLNVIGSVVIGGTLSNVGVATFGSTGSFKGDLAIGNTSSSAPALLTIQNSVNGGLFGLNTTGTPRFVFIDGGLAEVANINYSTGVYTAVSDAKLKRNIKYSSGSALEYLKKIRVRQYDWKSNNLHEPFGLIAQELHQVLPEYVFKPKNEKGSWGISKSEMVPFLIKVIQEQQYEIDELKKEFTEIKKLIKK